MVESTDDVFRRVKPATPDPHLVSYFVPIDQPCGRILLVEHRLAGLWLPPGGHVEPGEHPLRTVDADWGGRPLVGRPNREGGSALATSCMDRSCCPGLRRLRCHVA
jgi:8-oxo-dGTP pyrophosphatase MutT (NUDIX family)